ncbi:MAG: HTH domain-containing protein, partial [Eubacterium sp.]
SSETMIELTMAEIQTTLLEYIKITQNSLSLKSGYHYFELYTDAETIRKLTGDFKHCALYPVLSEKTAFSGTIGYGIGMDFYHARSNAVDACRYDAAFADHDTVSYLINAEDLTTGLLKESSKAPGIVYDLPKDHIQKIAKEVKLSSETIFKIMGVLKIENTDTLTSAILIKRLDLSLRTANRYLTNLEKYGYAEIIGKQQPMGKGRPINIYRLFLLQ